MLDRSSLSSTSDPNSSSSRLGSPGLQLPGIWRRGDSPLANLPADGCESARTTEAESSALGSSPFGLESPATIGGASTSAATRRSHVSQNDFEVLSLIGHGHAGTVVQLVKSRKSGLLFAMKTVDKWSLIEKRNSGDTKAIGRASAERNLHVTLASSIDCPYFVKFYYSFQTSRNLYYILEYCAWDVLEYVNHFGPLPEEFVILFMAEMTVAVEFLHRSGSIHRDIKLDNIMISSSGHVRLSDFGSSRKFDNDRCDSVVGFSTAIMPPEFFANKPSYGPAIDWYQLGICAYQTLTGVSPFGGQPLMDPQEATAWPPKWAPNTNPVLANWITALLHPDESLRLAGQPEYVTEPWEQVRSATGLPPFNKVGETDPLRLWGPPEEPEQDAYDPLPFQSFSYVRQTSFG